MAKKKQSKVTRKKAGQQPKKITKKAAKRRVVGSPSLGQPESAGKVGPLSLDEALAIVRGEGGIRKRRALGAGAEVAGATTAAATTVEMRVELKNQQQAEVEERIKEYTAAMSLMKERGVRGLEPETAVASTGRRRAGARSAVRPLQVFAEGDSWFHYPVPMFGGGVIDRLQKKLGVPILNLAKAGEEVRFMLGVQQRESLTKKFSDGCPAGGPWDVMLFSGGGNDIVGDPMALWIEDYRSNVSADKLINQTRFKAALEIVRAGYEDLIAIRKIYSPNTHLVFHGYDYAIPDGRGVCFYGPWLQPTFKHHKFPRNQTIASEVVKAMLTQFAEMVEGLATTPGVTFIKTQGTLKRDEASWHNELHPSAEGFNQIAELFAQKLKGLFPNHLPR